MKNNIKKRIISFILITLIIIQTPQIQIIKAEDKTNQKTNASITQEVETKDENQENKENFINQTQDIQDSELEDINKDIKEDNQSYSQLNLNSEILHKDKKINWRIIYTKEKDNILGIKIKGQLESDNEDLLHIYDKDSFSIRLKGLGEAYYLIKEGEEKSGIEYLFGYKLNFSEDMKSFELELTEGSILEQLDNKIEIECKSQYSYPKNIDSNIETYKLTNNIQTKNKEEDTTTSLSELINNIPATKIKVKDEYSQDINYRWDIGINLRSEKLEKNSQIIIKLDQEDQEYKANLASQQIIKDPYKYSDQRVYKAYLDSTNDFRIGPDDSYIGNPLIKKYDIKVSEDKQQLIITLNEDIDYPIAISLSTIRTGIANKFYPIRVQYKDVVDEYYKEYKEYNDYVNTSITNLGQNIKDDSSKDKSKKIYPGEEIEFITTVNKSKSEIDEINLELELSDNLSLNGLSIIPESKYYYIEYPILGNKEDIQAKSQKEILGYTAFSNQENKNNENNKTSKSPNTIKINIKKKTNIDLSVVADRSIDIYYKAFVLHPGEIKVKNNIEVKKDSEEIQINYEPSAGNNNKDISLLVKEFKLEEFNDTDQPHEHEAFITVRKVDSKDKNKVLANAELTIKKWNNFLEVFEDVGVATTNDKGEIYLKLQAAKYKIIEKTPPVSYLPNTEEICFSVNARPQVHRFFNVASVGNSYEYNHYLENDNNAYSRDDLGCYLYYLGEKEELVLENTKDTSYIPPNDDQLDLNDKDKTPEREDLDQDRKIDEIVSSDNIQKENIWLEKDSKIKAENRKMNENLLALSEKERKDKAARDKLNKEKNEEKDEDIKNENNTNQNKLPKTGSKSNLRIYLIASILILLSYLIGREKEKNK